MRAVARARRDPGAEAAIDPGRPPRPATGPDLARLVAVGRALPLYLEDRRQEPPAEGQAPPPEGEAARTDDGRAIAGTDAPATAGDSAADEGTQAALETGDARRQLDTTEAGPGPDVAAEGQVAGENAGPDAPGTGDEVRPDAEEATPAPAAEDSAPGAPGGPPATPSLETAAVALETEPLYLDPVAAPFRAPRRLEIAPVDRADELPPELRDYREAFASAAAAAARLHAEVERAGEREADAIRFLAGHLASARQSGLDRALADLGDGTQAALADLDAGAAAAQALLEAIADAAHRQIGGAAARVGATMRARATRMRRETTPARDEGLAMERWAADRDGDIDSAASDGRASLTVLADDPGPAFPVQGGSQPAIWLRLAQNEVIFVTMPPEARKEHRDLGLSQTAHSQRMAAAAVKLQSDLVEALRPFDDRIRDFTTTGPARVDRHRRAALAQLRRTTAVFRESVAASREAARAALIAQQNAQRAALVAGARSVAADEHAALEARGNRSAAGFGALAAGQGAAIGALHATFGQHRERPEEEFGRVVADGSRQAERTGREMTAERQGALADGAAQDRDRARERTALGIDRLGGSAAQAAAALGEAAAQTGAAQRDQIEATRPDFLALARPVAAVLAEFPAPTEEAFAQMLATLSTATIAAWREIQAAYTASPTAGGTAGPSESEAAQSRAPPTPHAEESPQAFVGRAGRIAAAPTSDAAERVYGVVHRDDAAVAEDVQSRVSNLRHAFAPISVDVEQVMSPLRGLTRNRGGAVEWHYNSRYGNLVDDLEWNLNAGCALSGISTRIHNIDAAIAHLRGDAVAGAQHELRAATEWWNDSARIDRVMKSLTPAQMDAFRAATEANADFQESVVGDLGDLDRQVYDHLVARRVDAADSLRLEAAIDRARQQRGDRGADATADTIREFRQQAGSSRLSGADRFALGERASEDEAERESRREAAWQGILTDFAARNPPAPSETSGPRPLGQALIDYATAERDYLVEGTYSQYEVRREGLRSEQQLLIRNLVEHAPDSAEVRAAQLLVERTRAGGAKHERVRQAVDDPALNVGLANPLDPAAVRGAKERADRAREDRARMYRLLDRYSHRDAPGRAPRDPEEIRAELGDQLAAGATGDASRGRYLRAMVTRDLFGEEVAVAAFEYAVDGVGTREQVLRSQFGSMSRDQIDAAVGRYDRTHATPLYDELGIHRGRRLSWTELSGDDANEIQVLSLGVARNDRERFEVAAMTARLQRADASDVGRWLAGDAAADMDRQYARMLGTAGVEEASFDELGRLRVPGAGEPMVGRFDDRGNFRPGPGQNHWDLGRDMIAARVAADTYRAATDSIANTIATTLIVAAAVLSTALTGGGAASIWIPVLVTLGAGVAAMGVSYAIKGGRYGYEAAAHDFAMTLVQSITAGVGAAAGVYLRGGSTALRAVSSRIAVSERAVERLLQLGGSRAFAALGFTDELIIGALAGGTGGFGGALLNDEAWDKGEFGSELGHGLARGMLGGVAGAGVMRPFSRMANATGPGGSARLASLGPAARQGLALTARGVGSGLSGAASSASELGYDYDRGKAGGSLHDLLNAVRDAGIQNAIQGTAEAGVENLGDESRRFSQWRQRLHRRPVPFGRTRRPAGRAATSEARDTAPARRPPPVHPEPAVSRADLEALDALATAAELGFRPADVLPPALAERPPPPRAPDEPPSATRPSREDEPTRRTQRPATDDEPTRRMQRVAADDEPTERTRRAQPEDEPTQPARRPGPVDPDDIPFLEVLPEMSGVMGPDPTDQAWAYDLYGKLVRETPDREAAIYHNPVTGEYVTFQGVAASPAEGRPARVYVESRGGTEEAPAAAGNQQRWKELLSADVGYWVLDGHFHPGRGDSPEWRLADRLPSGIGGDFGALAWESGHMGGAARRSRIHVLENGEFKHTDFAVDPASVTERYSVDFENPVTGQRERRGFATLADFETWRAEALRSPGAPASRDTTPTPPPVGPSTPRVPAQSGRLTPAPEGPPVTLLHGTSRAHLEAITAHGVRLDRIRGSGQGDDFGKAFYVTVDRATAELYAARRGAGAGGVAEFAVALHELGTVLDVRPGGAHRALWESFLDGNTVPWPDRPQGMSYREMLVVGYATEIRGQLFERFLAAHGFDPDIVLGDMGGLGTTGIVAAPGAEQVAIRSQAAADRLTAIMRGQSGPVVPQSGAAPPPPPPAPATAPEDPLAAGRRVRRREVEDIVKGMERRRGAADTDRLREFLLRGGDTMERLVAADNEEARVAALDRLRAELTQPVDLPPDRRAELVELVRRNRARSHPGEDPEAREAALRETLEGLSPERVEEALAAIENLRYDPSQHFGFHTARTRMLAGYEAPLDAAIWPRLDALGGDIEQVDALRAILEDPRARTLRAFARTTLVDGGAADWDLVQQWHAYLAHVERHNAVPENAADQRTVNLTGFDAFLRGYTARAQFPRFGEATVAFEAARAPVGGPAARPEAIERQLVPLKWAYDVSWAYTETDGTRGRPRSANNPHEPGTDFLGYDPRSNTIVYVDDKAWRTGPVDEVSALTTNLATNLRADAAELRRGLAGLSEHLRRSGEQAAAGHPGAGDVVGAPTDVVPDMPQRARQLATIPDRLVACAQEIDHFFPHGIDLSIPGHPELLAEITRRHGIELAVTNAAERGADRVSGRLSRAGFRFLQSSGPP